MMPDLNSQSLHNSPIVAAGRWAQARVCAVAKWAQASVRAAAEWMRASARGAAEWMRMGADEVLEEAGLKGAGPMQRAHRKK